MRGIQAFSPFLSSFPLQLCEGARANSFNERLELFQRPSELHTVSLDYFSEKRKVIGDPQLQLASDVELILCRISR